MAIREFPALGFDPAPGQPAVLDALGRDVAGHATLLGAAGQQAAEIRASGWLGHAADAFAAGIAPLPGELDRSVGAFGVVAGALSAYARDLDDVQRHATVLEQRAAQARAAQQRATGTVDVLGHGPDGETETARWARAADLRAAQRRAEAADGELAAILREAHGLEEHASGVAEQTARQIRAAAEQALYRKPSLLQQGLDRVQLGWQSTNEWVREHADALQTISGVLKGITTAAATLALVVQFVPVVGQVVGTIPLAVSATAGAAALGIDLLLKLSTGEGAWSSLGLDLALTIIPGAALTRVGRALLRPAASGLAAMARAPFVAKVLRPIRTTIRSAGLALPGVARAVRDRFATLGRRLVTDERGSIGIGQGGDAVSRPVRDGLRTTEYPDRAAARQALSGAQRQAANRFFKGATGKSVNFRSTELPNGGQRLEFFSPADNPGYGKLYVQEVDADGVTNRRYKDTMGPEGLIERKWIVGGP